MQSSSTAPERSTETGDTLIEVLIAVTITAMAVVGILGALLTSASSSISHRNMATFDAVLKSFAETARNSIQIQGSPAYACPVTSMYKIAGPLVPSSGPPGTPVAALGTGFAPTSNPLSTTGFSFPGAFNGSPTTWTASSNSSASGAIAFLTIPSNLPAGTYTADPFDTATPAGSDFTVTPWVGSVAPVIPTQVGAGTQIKFNVQGFAASSQLSINLAGTSHNNVSTTLATGAGSVVFTIPNGLTGAQPMTVTDAAGNSAPSVILNVGSDSAAATPVPASSALSSYQLTSSVSYWTGTTGDLTTTTPSDSSALWSSQASYCSGPNGNLELLSLDLIDNQPGQGGGDYFSVVIGNSSALNETLTSILPTSQTIATGQAVTFTATVSVITGSGTPTGNVEFFDNGTAISSCGGTSGVALSGTTATCSVPSGVYTSAGTHSITALYLGDSKFRGSMTYVPATLTVTKTPSSISTPASTSNPSVVGQAVTYTASVTPTSPVPTGYVEFFDGGTPITACGGSSGTAMTGNSASCTVTYSATGTHTITAQYLGDNNYNPSSVSGPLSQVINKASTSLAAPTPSANPVGTGQSVTYTASVSVTSPGSGTPTGNIEFFDGGTAITACGGTSGATMVSGSASCTTSYAATGTHTITAKYLGDSNYSASAVSPALSEQVLTGSSVSLSSASHNNRVKAGSSDTFTAAVTPTSPAPTGNVEFLENGTAIAACGGSAGVTVSGGQATCQVTFSTKGSYTITAQYLGDTNYAPSQPATLTETVN